MQQEAPAETRSPQREAWIAAEERSGNPRRRCGSGAFSCAPAFPAGVFTAFPIAWMRLRSEPESGSWVIHRLPRFHRWTGTRSLTASQFPFHPPGETTALPTCFKSVESVQSVDPTAFSRVRCSRVRSWPWRWRPGGREGARAWRDSHPFRRPGRRLRRRRARGL